MCDDGSVPFVPLYLRAFVPLNLTCPTCNKDFSVDRKEDVPYRPFCSKRCKLVDLGRWLDGTYTITEPLPEDQQQANPSEVSFEDDDG